MPGVERSGARLLMTRASISSPNRSGRSARRGGGWRPDRSCDGARDRVGEGLGRRFVDEQAGLSGHHRLERATAAERDHRPAARLRLERHDAEVLFAGQQNDRRPAVQIAHVGSVSRPRNCVSPPPAVRAPPLRTVSDDLQRNARALTRLDRQVDPLVGHERRHDEREALGVGPFG